MGNNLKNETSPYLLQHSENPVDWYPWGEEAFRRAKDEDKPVFLSIGYSTCHWCHVMAHESFEDEEVAALLNKHFISIKVDKEERPDIDSIYMSVCQAFTGSGGWPTSIFMTPQQKPFFAGTYFPKSSQGVMIGLKELLTVINEKWHTDRSALTSEAEKIVKYLSRKNEKKSKASLELSESAVELYKKIYDKKYGGFGDAPKFPTPHNLLFLMDYYERRKDEECLKMAEHTLLQMYRGGMFDHIGFGFCRYSTDREFLVPHFEKMLYDNALLILAYCKAYICSDKNPLYLKIAEKTADYILREMTSPEGGFFSAQDADSEGEEGKYYLFTPDEIIKVLGDSAGHEFNHRFGISNEGNFEGENIPNLLNSAPEDWSFDSHLNKLNEYRKTRYSLHLDDKILTSWNSLMIAAMCTLYCVSSKEIYLRAAENADKFIKENLSHGNELFVSYRNGKRGVKGFLDDYASYIFATLQLYRATLKTEYLERAKRLSETVISKFKDENGGFFHYSADSEKLIMRPKETYDGAIPSGNSLMALNLVRLSQISSDEYLKKEAAEQLDFLAPEAESYPTAHAMFLSALLEYYEPPVKITVVLKDITDFEIVLKKLPENAIINVLPEPTDEYPIKNNKTTFYICKDYSCLPPVNEL